MTDQQSRQKAQLGDWSSAMRIRDVIRGLIRREIERLRPLPRYGRVLDFNRTTQTVDVILVGDVEPTRVKMTLGVQPTRRDVVDGDGNGDFVKVEGSTRNQWVTAILNGPQFMERVNLYNPRIIGGKQLDRTIAANFSLTVDLPETLGNSMYLGRFDNESADADGLATIIAVVQQFGEGWVSKYYIINLQPSDSGGQWKRCIPNGYTEQFGGNDFQLEINTPDNHSFELRVRRTAGLAVLGGYDFTAQVFGQNWVKQEDYPPLEDSDPAPLLTHGTMDLPLVSQLAPLAGYEKPSYRRSPSGVKLQGVATNISGATLANNFVMFTMPKGMRPLGRRIFIQTYTGGRARVDVWPNGQVIVTEALGSNAFISFDGISYPPEQ